jgi:hypothetical protein
MIQGQDHILPPKDLLLIKKLVNLARLACLVLLIIIMKDMRNNTLTRMCLAASRELKTLQHPLRNLS